MIARFRKTQFAEMNDGNHAPEPGTVPTSGERLYWEGVLGDGTEALDRQWEWLGFSRSRYVEWIRSYLEVLGPQSRVMKTNGFEEIRGAEVTEALREWYGRVVVIDLAHAALRQSAHILPLGATRCLENAAQHVPFEPESFDVVLSLSTLDHFKSVAEIRQSLREVHDATQRGGLPTGRQ